MYGDILKNLEGKEILEVSVDEVGKWFLYLTNGEVYELFADNGSIVIEKNR